MLALNHETGKSQPPVLETTAPRGEGVPALLDRILLHESHLRSAGELKDRELRMAEWRVLKLARSLIALSLREQSALIPDLERVARRELSPYLCARTLLSRAAPAE